jgi:hypothetical protein
MKAPLVLGLVLAIVTGAAPVRALAQPSNNWDSCVSAVDVANRKLQNAQAAYKTAEAATAAAARAKQAAGTTPAAAAAIDAWNQAVSAQKKAQDSVRGAVANLRRENNALEARITGGAQRCPNLDSYVGAVANASQNVQNAQVAYENAELVTALAARSKQAAGATSAAPGANDTWNHAVDAQKRARDNVSSAITNLNNQNKLLKLALDRTSTRPKDGSE